MQSPAIEEKRQLPTNLANTQFDAVPANGGARYRDVRLLTVGRPAVALGRRRYSSRGKPPSAKLSLQIKAAQCINSSKGNRQRQEPVTSSEVETPLVGQEIHLQDPRYTGNRCSDTSGITLPDFGSEEFALNDDDYEESDDFCSPGGSGNIVQEEAVDESQVHVVPDLLRNQSTDTLPSIPRRRSSNVSEFSSNPSLLSSHQRSSSSSYLRRISNHSKSDNDTLPQAPGRSMSTGTATLSNDIDYTVLQSSFSTNCVIQEEESEAETETATEESLSV